MFRSAVRRKLGRPPSPHNCFRHAHPDGVFPPVLGEFPPRILSHEPGSRRREAADIPPTQRSASSPERLRGRCLESPHLQFWTGIEAMSCRVLTDEWGPANAARAYPVVGVRGTNLRACLKTRPVRAPGLQATGFSAKSCRPRALTRRSPQSFQTRSERAAPEQKQDRKTAAGSDRTRGI